MPSGFMGMDSSNTESLWKPCQPSSFWDRWSRHCLTWQVSSIVRKACVSCGSMKEMIRIRVYLWIDFELETPKRSLLSSCQSSRSKVNHFSILGNLGAYAQLEMWSLLHCLLHISWILVSLEPEVLQLRREPWRGIDLTEQLGRTWENLQISFIVMISQWNANVGVRYPRFLGQTMTNPPTVALGPWHFPWFCPRFWWLTMKKTRCRQNSNLPKQNLSCGPTSNTIMCWKTEMSFSFLFEAEKKNWLVTTIRSFRNKWSKQNQGPWSACKDNGIASPNEEAGLWPWVRSEGMVPENCWTCIWWRPSISSFAFLDWDASYTLPWCGGKPW